jgi:hypothetical protein
LILIFFSFNGQHLELRKTKKNLWKSVWSRDGQPDSVCGTHLKKTEQNSKHRKITEFRHRNFFLGRGLATPGLEAERAIFRLKKSSKNKIQKKNFDNFLKKRRKKSVL